MGSGIFYLSVHCPSVHPSIHPIHCINMYILENDGNSRAGSIKNERQERSRPEITISYVYMVKVVGREICLTVGFSSLV